MIVRINPNAVAINIQNGRHFIRNHKPNSLGFKFQVSRRNRFFDFSTAEESGKFRLGVCQPYNRLFFSRGGDAGLRAASTSFNRRLGDRPYQRK
jgi:hypothetical protein